MSNEKFKYHTGLDDLSKLIIQAIEDECFFEKSKLIPKVRAIMKGFHYNQNLTRYNAIESPSDSARRLRAIESATFRCNFFRDKLKEICTTDQFQCIYDELNKIENKTTPNE